jgi:hypothetical protein
MKLLKSYPVGNAAIIKRSIYFKVTYSAIIVVIVGPEGQNGCIILCVGNHADEKF